jgi:DNA-binding MarR family transcriptional regulator
VSTVAIVGSSARGPSSVTGGACAARLVDVAPLVVRFIRVQMRRRMPGLTMAQFRTMAFLYRRSGCSLRALAVHLGVTAPTCSVLVDRLVRRGVVSRSQSQTSRREVALRLTQRGRTQFEAAKEAARWQTARVLTAVPDAALRRLNRDLDALATAFTEAEMNLDR